MTTDCCSGIHIQLPQMTQVQQVLGCLREERVSGIRRPDISNRHTLNSPSEITNFQNITGIPRFRQSFRPCNEKKSFQTSYNNSKNHLIPLKLAYPHDQKRYSCQNTPNQDRSKSCPQPTRRRPRPAAVTALKILPLTENDWNILLEEVKSLYLNGRHKHCSIRCRLILEGIRNSYPVNPIYLVYISYYLATSLETMAFSAPENSSSKLPLYKEALVNYRIAMQELERAPFSADAIRRTSRLSCLSPRSYSVRSSVDSVFSQYSKSSSMTSRSASSDESSQKSEDNESEGPQPRPKKKVSFSASTITSPKNSRKNDDLTSLDLVSPTSFSDNLSSPSSSRSTTPVYSLNKVPSKSSFRDPLEPPPLALPGNRAQTSTSSPSPKRLAHLLRYHDMLLSFRMQLIYHTTSIETIINEMKFHSIPAVKKPTLKFTGSLADRMRFVQEEKRTRKRFDATRYKDLCERALSEL